MINKLFIGMAIALLASCSHKPQSETSPRLPTSQPTKSFSQVVNQCGEIRYSEDNYVARDKEELMYSLILDCNKDRKITEEDGKAVIGIPLTHLKPQQKSWLTRWKRSAVAANGKSDANPYVCATVYADEDPCKTGRSVYGIKPRFVGSVYNVYNPAKKGK